MCIELHYPDIRIYLVYELFGGDPGAVAPVEHLVRRPTEEFLACRFVGLQPFFDIGQASPTLLQMQIIPTGDSGVLNRRVSRVSGKVSTPR
jgi:hypothetical protein